MKFRRKPIEVEAHEWNKNGDHPLDNCKELPKGDGTVFLSEGAVVRFFRHPSMAGDKTCRYCSRLFADHGWIDSPNGGFVVCPGDFILSEPKNPSKGFYPVKPNVFAEDYEKASGIIALS